MSLCPEREYRDSLTEPEFWDYVLLGLRPGEYVEPEPDADLDDPVTFTSAYDPCAECGQIGPCGYDYDGRPMVHVVESEDA